MEHIVETRFCKQCGTVFTITDKDLEFYDKISPIFGGKKYAISAPTLCPDCRKQRRFSFRNERKLYKRTCDATGKQIISIYSPDKPYKVYSQELRRSDTRDPLSYGISYDPTNTFFDQFMRLYREVPKIALYGHISNKNSEYVNFHVNSKDSYLCFGGGFGENVSYGTLSLRCHECIDIYFCFDCISCYETSYSTNCYNIFYANNCENCREGYFIENCTGCMYCFGCDGLYNQKYCIFNKNVSKEEYKAFIYEYFNNIGYINEVNQKAKEFLSTTIKKNLHIFTSENCTGNHIMHSKNCIDCNNIDNGQDLRYCTDSIGGLVASYDSERTGAKSELIYESVITSMNSYGIAFCMVARNNSKNLYYSMDMNACSNCFGCVGLNNKQYCIFNKQYTREEYELLVPKIIEQMQTNGERGEFFPISISPFCYNETVAQDYYPLNKEKCIGEGFLWTDTEFAINIPQGIEMLNANELPNIQDVKDNILQQAILCEVTGKPFRIVKSELEFYRKHNLPLPRKHPDVRHLERMQLRNPRKLRNRKCDKCGIDIQTTYAPERPEIVYCEECYNKEIYG